MSPKLAIPTDSVGLEELLNDATKMKSIWKEGQFGELTKAYATSMAANHTDELKTQMQLGMTQFLRDNGKALTPKIDLNFHDDTSSKMRSGSIINAHESFPLRKHNLYNKATLGAKVDKLFNSQGDFFRALSLKANLVARLDDGPNLLEKLAENDRIRATYGSNVPADGGFLVPEEFRSDLLMVSLESSVMRPRATIIPM